MGNFTQYLTTKTFFLIDVLFIIGIATMVKSAWFSVDPFTRFSMAVLLAMPVGLMILGFISLADKVYYESKRKRIELRMFERGQLPTPPPRLPATKIVEEETENL